MKTRYEAFSVYRDFVIVKFGKAMFGKLLIFFGSEETVQTQNHGVHNL